MCLDFFLAEAEAESLCIFETLSGAQLLFEKIIIC